jgi:transcription elongation factor GreB
MSKAFTRESDDAPELPVAPRAAALPPGARNYLTPGGERRLREELHRLVEIERPPLAVATGDADARPRLRALDQRVLQLRQCLQTAEVVPPPAPPWDRVRFGATVTVRERSGEMVRYRLVGLDEADPARDWIHWRSPLAQTLLNARAGDHVKVSLPAGEQELEIVGITYE